MPPRSKALKSRVYLRSKQRGGWGSGRGGAAGGGGAADTQRPDGHATDLAWNIRADSILRV